jgi:hypothetical protein
VIRAIEDPPIQNHAEVIPLVESRFTNRLRRLIGRECRYLGRRCRLVEVLGDEGALVLEVQEETPPIQTDQYGHPANRANELLQVAITGSDQSELSEEVLELLSLLDGPGRGSAG